MQTPLFQAIAVIAVITLIVFLARRSHSDDMAAATVPPATPATFTVSANTQSGDNAPNPNNKTAVQIHREHVERLKELMRQQAAEQHAHTSE